MRLHELKVPFRWYDNINFTTMRNRECSAYRYKLITPKDRLLPFLFRFPTPANTALPLHLRIYNSDTGALAYEIGDNITASQIDYLRTGQWDYLVYKGSQTLFVEMAHGFYYAELEMENEKKYYSEEFWVDCDDAGSALVGDFNDDFNDDFLNGGSSTLSKYSKLTWWHPCDIGDLLYQTGYRNMLYLDVELIKSETEIVEEGDEGGNKDFVVHFVKTTDKVAFSDYVPEHIINALSGVHMHENVLITAKENRYVGKARRFNCKYTFETDCHGRAEVDFLQETKLIRSGCCDNNVVQDIYRCQGIISDLSYDATENGDGTSAVVIYWNVLLGAGPYRIQSPQISGGAWHEISGTNHSLGNWASGVQLYVTVKPRCTASNGRTMFGNELSLVIQVP